MRKKEQRRKKQEIIEKLDQIRRLVEIMDGDIEIIIGYQYGIATSDLGLCDEMRVWCARGWSQDFFTFVRDNITNFLEELSKKK